MLAALREDLPSRLRADAGPPRFGASSTDPAVLFARITARQAELAGGWTADVHREAAQTLRLTDAADAAVDNPLTGAGYSPAGDLTAAVAASLIRQGPAADLDAAEVS